MAQQAMTQTAARVNQVPPAIRLLAQSVGAEKILIPGGEHTINGEWWGIKNPTESVGPTNLPAGANVAKVSPTGGLCVWVEL